MSTRTSCGILLRVMAALAFLAFAVPVAAQTPYIPYFGKNQIRYDKFEWFRYETDHFIIYYYPEIEPHLERMAGYAESAYQQVSSELKHDLAHKVPLILFQTSSEFQQQNVIPGAAQEGVGAFAEPIRQRIVMPMDEPPDLLYRLILHELTHQFDYDIIPASLVRRTTPLWVHEGLADYMTGIWRPLDLMSVRDAAVADIIPKMSKLEGYSDVGGARMIYNLGHAIFEFIEAKWGKEGSAAVPVLAAQVGDRRRRRRLRGSVQDHRRGIRPGVREVPQGSLQAVPGQGASRRLRPEPPPQPREDAVPRRLHRRTVSVRGSAGDLLRQLRAIARATSSSSRRATAASFGI